MRRISLAALIAGASLATLLACAGTESEPDTQEPATLRILPAGDSITYGHGGHYYGYRGFLNDLCAAAGLQIVFVGAETENLGVGEGHEGHPGLRSDEILALIPGWLQQTSPDVVLLHSGTNDIYQNRPVTEAIVNIEATLDAVARLRPTAWCLLATPGPFRSPKNVDAIQLGQNLTQMVQRRAAAGQKVALVDTRARLAESTAGLPALLMDSAHPSDLGYYLMAKAWFEGLRRLPR